MAVLSLIGATSYVGGYDLTGDTHKVHVAAMAEELDVTTFSTGATTLYRSRIAGLKDVEASWDGYWQAGSGLVDADLFPNLGTADQAVTVSPTGTETATAYLTQVGRFNVELFGGVGEVAPFALSAKGTNTQGLVRGQLAAAKQSKSSTGVLGSVCNITAPSSSSQYVYCAVHVFSAGTTVTLQLQSDTAAGFPSATTQATIGALTAAGGTWMTRIAGGSLSGEDYWRLNISAITGTFSLAATIGVR
jgi:hypothetical protein